MTHAHTLTRILTFSSSSLCFSVSFNSLNWNWSTLWACFSRSYSCGEQERAWQQVSIPPNQYLNLCVSVKYIFSVLFYCTYEAAESKQSISYTLEVSIFMVVRSWELCMHADLSLSSVYPYLLIYLQDRSQSWKTQEIYRLIWDALWQR